MVQKIVDEIELGGEKMDIQLELETAKAGSGWKMKATDLWSRLVAPTATKGPAQKGRLS